MPLNARATCSMFAAAMLGLMIVPIAFVGIAPQVDSRSADSLVQSDDPESLASGNPPEFTVAPLDPTQGQWNTSFNFTAWLFDSENDIMTVTWDWGDGSPLEVSYTGDTTPYGGYWLLQNEHIYNPYVPGRGNDFGTDYETLWMNITLDDGNGNNVSDMTKVEVVLPPNRGPQAPSIALSPPSAFVSEEVTICTNSSDPEGDPLTWTYMFNDSVSDYLTILNQTPQSEPDAIVWSNITMVFNTAGDYNLSTYVSDALPPYQLFPHNVSRKVLIRVVENTPPLVAPFIVFSPSSPVLNLSIGYVVVVYVIETFDPDGDIITATWDFGDGSPVEVNVSGGGPSIYSLRQTRNYTDEGSFNISVVVTDGRQGHEVERNVTVTIQVLNHRPVASFTVDPLTGDTSTDFMFDASSSSDIETPNASLMVRWDFDNDGTWDTGWSTGKMMNHQFSASGTYIVVLEVRDASGLTNTTALEVVVTEAIPEFDGLVTPILLLAFVLVLFRWRMPPRTR